MKIEKVTEKLELNVQAQGDDCNNDCKEAKESSPFYIWLYGEHSFMGCYYKRSKKYTSWF